MTLPNFLVLGAYKSGTTALDYYLKAHPDIYMSPRKELQFFSHDPTAPHAPLSRKARPSSKPVTTLEQYTSYFAGATTELAIGEVTPRYLPSEIAPVRVQELLDDPRFIIILRDPADRAFSHLSMINLRGRVHLPAMSEVVANYRNGVEQDVPEARKIIDVGFYSAQIKHWWSHFPRERFAIYLFEDLNKDAVATIQDISSFLGVSSDYEPDTSKRHNVSGVPKNKAVNRVLEAARWVADPIMPHIPERAKYPLIKVRNLNIEKTRLAKADRSELIDVYRDDIVELQTMLGRDLSRWLQP